MVIKINWIIYVYIGQAIRVFANGPRDLGSILGRVIPKTQKMVLDAFLLNPQHYKAWSKGKVDQYRERSVVLPLRLDVVAIEKGAFESPSTMVANFTYHHHHDVRLARINLTLSLHVSLSFIAFSRSSGLHSVSSHSCCMNVRAGRPAFNWLYAGVHRSTSLTFSSLLLQQCPACLVRLACIVFVISGRWPYSWRRVGCCC